MLSRAVIALGLFLVCCFGEARAGGLLLLGAGSSSTGGGGGGYSGPADILTTAVGCWSLRACKSATRGNAAVKVCNALDATCADMSTDATTGALVVTTVGGTDCGAATCTIKTWYDQVGSTNFTQATIGNRATFKPSCLGSLPCGQLAAASSQGYTAVFVGTGIAPYTFNWVADRTGNTGAINSVLSAGGAGNVNTGFSNAANLVFIYDGTLQTAAAADNAWHSVTGMFNSASSVINVDGTETTVSPNNLQFQDTISLGANNAASQFTTGNIAEAIYTLDLVDGTHRSSLCHNQFAYWGTATSC